MFSRCHKKLIKSDSECSEILGANRRKVLLVLFLFLCVFTALREINADQIQDTKSSPRPGIPRLPLTKFYITPHPLPAGKPGELIRAVEFGGYDLLIGVTVYRFLYHSRSAAGDDVVSSGVILFPDKKPPTAGWPVIAWAHDASAVSRQCAPSLERNLQHGPLLAMYVNLGYAVVATDYTGLGTNFRNAAADSQSNAWDIIYSIPAARSALGQLGSKWVAIGMGEGGMAAVAVDELERDLRDPNYLGSIAVPRLVDLEEMYEPPSSYSVMSVLRLAYGIKTLYPKFDVKDVLTDPAVALFEQVGTACEENRIAGSQKIDPATLLKPNWKSNAFVQQYFNRNKLGTKPAIAPLLMATSADDPLAPVSNNIFSKMCKMGDRVQFQKYPQEDPGRVIGDSVRDQMAWLQARFAGRNTPTDCGQ
jgi:hypothetical protein